MFLDDNEKNQNTQQQPMNPAMKKPDPCLNYRVNLFIDNSEKTGVPVIDETNPNHIEEKYHRVIVEESKTDDLYLMIEKNILKLISKNLDLSKYCNLASQL